MVSFGSGPSGGGGSFGGVGSGCGSSSSSSSGAAVSEGISQSPSNLALADNSLQITIHNLMARMIWNGLNPCVL